MGYNIFIGNAEVRSSWVSKYDDEPWAAWEVKYTSKKDSPSFDDSGHTNQRNPSYSAWADFARETGLYDFFLDKDEGKMRRHPGCCALTPEDNDFVQLALHKYKRTHPDSEAVICKCKTCSSAAAAERDYPAHNPNADMNLVRLVWLAWWVDWAVKKCARPAISNT